MKYNMTVGIETHIELNTETKIFCGCSTRFGCEPNTNCCAVCMGHPGTLPVLNKRVPEYAVKAGLALNCEISEISHVDRKNYTYPDLPKAYQITQFDVPLCKNGYILLDSGQKIGITRIHIEEDAGKLVHTDSEILIDYNRAGVPLLEIVSEPDIKSVEQAEEYIEKLRLIMRYLGISDCKMQEGSMRCDVNVSLSTDDTLGVRTEIKNMNSVSNILRAISYEAKRQAEILQSGGTVVRETLGFNEKTGTTYGMRGKEASNDYRFFREPDLGAVHISREEIEKIKSSLPELPQAKTQRFTELFGLSQADSRLLVKYPRVASFFEKSVSGLKSPRNCANFILGQIFAYLKTEAQKEEFNLKITPKAFNELMLKLENGLIGTTAAKGVLANALEKGEDLDELLTRDDIKIMSKNETLSFCRKAVESNPKAVADYKNGKDKALMVLVGFVMKNSSGRADPQTVGKILRELLNRNS